MYNNLQKINLTNYLDECCGGKKWIEESWLQALDGFVGTLSDENKFIFESKINNNRNHCQINDIVNELMIACAFHPKADFVAEGTLTSCDLIDNNSDLKIEIKTLNEGDDERDRRKKNSCCWIAAAPSEKESTKEKELMQAAISNKCKEHVKKAVNQISEKGKIYVVYDWNLLTSKNIGAESPVYVNTHWSPLPRDAVKSTIDICVNETLRENSGVQIEVISLDDLRKKVAKSIVSNSL